MSYTKPVSDNLPKPVGFDWDKGNIDKNLDRHKVSYTECEEVFGNRPLKIFEDAKHSLEEKRFVAHGITNRKRKLTIIFCLRNNKIRVISARDMNKKERGEYEKT